MTVLDVYLNDRQCCRAGVGSDGVLTAMVTWVKLTGPAAERARRMRQPVEESQIHVGGLRTDTHRTWLERNLRIGDRVAIIVKKARAADRPLGLQPRVAPRPIQEGTTFLNVDLDIRSRSSLEPLVKALGPSMFALHVGREGRDHVAHLEVARQSSDPNRLIRQFVRVIERLPRAERRMWNRARHREFNVGVQAGPRPPSYDLRLDPATVRAAARVDAAIGFTVYASTLTAVANRRT